MREYHCVEYAANGSGEKTVHHIEYSSVKALKWVVHMKRMFPEIAKCFKVEVHSYKPMGDTKDQEDKGVIGPTVAENQTVALKPCPLCKGEVELRDKTDRRDETFFFHCLKCHMWFEKFDYRAMDRQSVIRDWNRRVNE